MSVYRNNVIICTRMSNTIGGDRERLQNKREEQEKTHLPMFKRGELIIMTSYSTLGSPVSLFYYKEDYYYNKTEIVLADTYIKSHKFNGKPLWKYAKFDHKIMSNGKVLYFFCRCKDDWLTLRDMGIDAKTMDEYATFFTIDAFELENAIQEILKPIKMEKEKVDKVKEAMITPKHDWDYPTLMFWWVIYIIAMIASLIFRQFYIIWGVASYLFFKYRKEILDS